MKKILLILIVTIVTSVIETKAQSAGVPDTLAYLQQIVVNKALYIGQPFSKLKDSLSINIKYFWPNSSVVYDKSKEPSTHFSFYFPQTAEETYLTYPCLAVYWQMPLNANISDVLWENNNGGGWSPAVAAFYANAIIADIKVWE